MNLLSRDSEESIGAPPVFAAIARDKVRSPLRAISYDEIVPLPVFETYAYVAVRSKDIQAFNGTARPSHGADVAIVVGLSGFTNPGTDFALRHGITLIGRLFDEGLLGRVGVALERAFNVASERPKGFS